MGQNDASAGLQPRSISALEVQGGDGVVSDLFDGNAAERLKVWLAHDGNKELGSVRIESIAPDINLFDIQKSRVEENEAASSSTSNKACERSCITNTP